MQGYRIGSFVLDLDRRQLLVGDQPLGLTPKNFDLLWEFAKAEGRLLSRDELAKLVWPDTAIEEATLRQNIYTLRSLLREADPEREYLENVPKVGYRLAVPVEKIVARIEEAPTKDVAPRSRRRWMLTAAIAMLVLTGLAFAGLWNRSVNSAIAHERAAELIRQAWIALDYRDSERFPAIQTLVDDALKLEPRSAEAHGAKALLLLLWSREKDAEAEAARTAELDPASGVPFAVRGFIKMMYHWEWTEAGKLLEEATLRGCPDSFCRTWYGWYLGFKGEPSNAVREISGALERNPARLAARATYGQMLYWAGDNDAAIRELKTVVDAAGNATHARLHLWKAQLAAGDRKAASRSLLLAIEPAWYRLPQEDQIRALVARTDLYGSPEFFRRMVAASKTNNTNAYYVAEIAMAAGDEREALDQLERSLAQHLFFLPYAKRDPLFEPLRGTPRFEAVMKQVGL